MTLFKRSYSRQERMLYRHFIENGKCCWLADADGRRIVLQDLASCEMARVFYLLASFSRGTALAEPLPDRITNMRSEQAWLNHVADVYAAHGQWSTPSELFRPFYGQAIARWILSLFEREKKQHLNIVEVGGGTGHLAQDILDWLSSEAPSVSQRTHYTIVEISPALAELQRQVLAKKHAPRHTVVERSVFDFDDRRRRDQHTMTVVLALEVLDNLAHDKVVLPQTGGALHAVVSRAANNAVRESYTPLTDSLTRDCLHAFLAHEQQTGPPSAAREANFGRVVYLPTRALQLARFIGDAHALLADFDAFPRDDAVRCTRLPQHTHARSHTRGVYISVGTNAPLIQRRRSADNTDLDTFVDLATPGRKAGSCDIMFATDFRLLQRFLAPRQSAVRKQALFLEQHGARSSLSTRSGYFVADMYPNMSVLTTTATGE